MPTLSFSKQYALTLVYGAQFLSALADNALLIIAIVLLKQQAQLETIPWLQASFLMAYIVLAPWVGLLADAITKGRVMSIGNLLKIIGCGLIIWPSYPLVGYALVGVGAAIYSPAKYGILVQLVQPHHLVKANGGMESSTLLAILLGVVIGGLLADWHVQTGLWLVMGLYIIASLLNLLIPKLPIESPWHTSQLTQHLTSFWHSITRLWQSKPTRQSLLATSLFWSVGSTLRLMLFAWVPLMLAIDDNQLPATLMGMVSIGIMLGAGLSAWRIHLSNDHLAFYGGWLLAPLLLTLIWIDTQTLAMIVMVLLGAAGGWFIVPLNARLQAYGQATTGTGQALAVQNLFENIAMLIAVSCYGWLQNFISLPTFIVFMALGLCIALWLIQKPSR